MDVENNNKAAIQPEKIVDIDANLSPDEKKSVVRITISVYTLFLRAFLRALTFLPVSETGPETRLTLITMALHPLPPGFSGSSQHRQRQDRWSNPRFGPLSITI